MSSRTSVAVLGAGLQGACVALALSHRGFRIHLIDQAPKPMLRASLRNEGKIHLGFIYANDRSFRTADLMFEAGLSFGPLVDSWLPEPVDWRKIRSPRFLYLVMRDSMVDRDALHRHYEQLVQRHDASNGERGLYLGTELRQLWRPVPLPRFVARAEVQSAIETEEAAIDLAAFRRRIVSALRSCERISWHPCRRVETVARRQHGFVIEGDSVREPGGWSLQADSVVNCLWEGRLSIDREMGLEPKRPWVYRLKYRVLAELPPQLASLPALTMTLGPYGDIVPMGKSSYLSWYPLCRRGWSSALESPRGWEKVCNGVVDEELRSSLSAAVCGALDRVVPGIRQSRTTGVDAGIIFSWGRTDIDQQDSGLHQRFAVGIHGGDGYYSIDTGKLTCAPYFAHRLAERLTA